MSAAGRIAAPVVALFLAALGLTSTGCDTAAYCFTDCAGDASPTGTNTASGGAGTGGSLFGGTGGDAIFGCNEGGGGSGAGGPCVPTNGGTEACDGIDNDCNGKIDDSADIDFGAINTCGTCNTNCLAELTGCGDMECVPSANPGVDPGTCKCNDCAADFYDLDGDGKSCEYYCVASNTSESTCNALDDDCDGQKDEDVDFCTSTTDCGYCNNNCVVLHGTPTCTLTGAAPCVQANTKCEIQACDAGWVDLDGSYATGCEYQCTETGPEVCGDGLDNDCDGAIDDLDPDIANDPQIGVQCFGDPDGLCATVAHAGTTVCSGNQVVCEGNDVIHENDVLETCNGEDDDCDGVDDDSPTDVGGSCGQSNIFPCSFGAFTCVNGGLVCNGAVNPGTESCNGVDDNCDGQIDKTGANPPADSVGACNVPLPPPPMATSPCKAGTKACVGGTVACQGSVVAQQGASDTCGVDANCDGQLTNQPNKQTDVANCGSCGNNCMANAVHANWGCTNGGCVFLGCEGGYYDLNNDKKCEYACTFVSAQESCNGSDDNCNGQIDEGVVAPSPVQVCGVSPSATASECKATTQGGQVQVACQAGAWKCTFPANVCSPTCSGATEICDALDNDCDGVQNENVANWNKPCASDDVAPGSQGACRQTGTFQCVTQTATACNAVAANCTTLPGGCTEVCDGVDNDCDGSVDEPYTAKGTNAANFVKPAVTKISSLPNRWVMSFEASRPSATTTVPGSGNGYRCVSPTNPDTTGTCTVSGSTVPSAPSSTTLDKVNACSTSGKIPWFNVSPSEAEQVCAAQGGFVCGSAAVGGEWRNACQVNPSLPELPNNCTWGYSPKGVACTSTYTGAKFCNLGPSFDFSSSAAGDQDGLLVTGSAELLNCFADWSNLQGNVAANNKIYDLTGNLREITKNGTTYRLMGGAFDTQDAGGATCTFDFYTVDRLYKFYDTGFRCCYSADPTL